MTKEQAITEFWNSFGIPAYEESSIYSLKLKPPYITFELNTDNFGNEVPLTASIWYRSYSWVEVNAKAREVAKKLMGAGVILDSDAGRIWLKRGSPFENRMGDDSDDMIKRVQLNIAAEFFTNY